MIYEETIKPFVLEDDAVEEGDNETETPAETEETQGDEGNSGEEN